jgi:hypothetical protein
MDEQPRRNLACEPASEQDTIEAHLQKLCDARDRTAPGSAEERQAALALLDAMLSGGRLRGREAKETDREDSF